MLVLRADPWDPGYGPGFDAPVVERTDEDVQPFVETTDWSEGLSPPPSAAGGGPLAFVDGVMRPELRLIGEEDGKRAPGMFGSFAVGVVHVDGRATFGEHAVGRAAVLGGGLVPEPVEVSIGGLSLTFGPASDPGTEPEQPFRTLLRLMQEAEARTAAALVGGAVTLVLSDGPLQFHDPAGLPVVGVVKRYARQYLPTEQEALLARLVPGTRTPLFLIGRPNSGLQRYAWYARLVPQRPHWHDHAGVARCEVSGGVGLERAVGLADRVTALLPRFAGRASDPRTPQNLAPVGALERRIRHLMGDARLIRRALTGYLIRRGG